MRPTTMQVEARTTAYSGHGIAHEALRARLAAAVLSAMEAVTRHIPEKVSHAAGSGGATP